MNKPSFIDRFYTGETKRERLRIIQDLVKFVIKGLEARYGKPYLPPYVKAYEAAVSSILFDRFAEAPLKVRKSFRPDEGDTVELLAEALSNAKQILFVKEICLPYLPADIGPKLEQRLPFTPFTYVDEYEPSVRGAYQCAKDNFLLSETRKVCLTALNKLINPSTFHNMDVAGDQEIFAELSNRSISYLSNILLFGSLLGGAEAREALRLVAREYLYDSQSPIKMSIMSHITPNGRTPSIWLTKTEDSFRADIIKKMKEI